MAESLQNRESRPAVAAPFLSGTASRRDQNAPMVGCEIMTESIQGRPMMPRAFRFCLPPLLALALSAPAASQGTVPSPGPVQSAPLAPPAPAPTSPAPAAPATAARPTLVPNSGDPVNVDEVVLPSKPSAVLSGQSTWEDGFKNLKNGFRKIEEELTRAGISPAGRPITVFVETEDMGFRYDAMIPIPAAPAGQASLSPEVRFGKTPEGKHLRFVHKDAYDEIDATYETIEAYLEAKGIAVKPVFVEEYVTDLTESTDTNLEINVFVQPE